MKKQLLPLLSISALFTLASCGESSEPADTTDTLVQKVTDTMVVIESVDTAAIISYYEAQHAKAKGTHKLAHKPHATKKVATLVDSDPIIVAHDAAPVASAPASADAKPAVVVVHDTLKYYFLPDQKAAFGGGEAAFDKYLSENLVYPEAALDANVSKVLYPTVFLDETGKVTDVQFKAQPTIYGFQDEARRVLMSAPAWVPAKHGGQAVKSKFVIPIRFEIK